MKGVGVEVRAEVRRGPRRVGERRGEPEREEAKQAGERRGERRACGGAREKRERESHAAKRESTCTRECDVARCAHYIGSQEKSRRERERSA